MTSKRLRLVLYTLLGALGLGSVAVVGGPRTAASTPVSSEPAQRYLIVLGEAPLAEYAGGIQGLAATAVEAVQAADPGATRSVHLDVTSSAAQAYRAFLLRRQRDVMRSVRALAPEFSERDWQYQYVLNGFTAQLTSPHADAVRQLSGVRLVFPAEQLLPEMDATQSLIDTPVAWAAGGGADLAAGAGVRIGILEAGNAVTHPFFRDEGMGAPPAGFPQAKYYLRDGTSHVLTNTVRLVNNKIVAFKPIADSLTDTELSRLNAGLMLSTHGSHVAGTMAGRWGKYQIRPGIEVEMAGIAPMAHLFSYPILGATPEMIKAFEVMVEDRIDAVNLSLGTSTWLLDVPDRHPVSLAMSAAAKAGMVVVHSAGNAGSNGPTSLSAAWKYNEDVLAVANTSSNGWLGVPMTLTVPADLPAFLKTGTVGILRPPTAPITAGYAYVAGGGCTAAAEGSLRDKIAVLEFYDERDVTVGTCSLTQRVDNAKAGGAQAVLMTRVGHIDATFVAANTSLPAVAMGGQAAAALLDRLQAGGPVTGTIGSHVRRGYDAVADYITPSSSRGPGLNWSIKPDVAAPGTFILSSTMADENTTDNLPPAIPAWTLNFGTSMAAPHVTGAAGLLRSIHPDWSAMDIRSALLTTASPSVTSIPVAAPALADPLQGGVGRLDLSDAWDPRAILDPPKLAFGKLGAGESRTIAVQVASATAQDTTWSITVEPGAGNAAVTPSTQTVMVPARGSARFSVHIAPPATGAADEHWGYVVLREQPHRPRLFLPALLGNGSLPALSPTSIPGPIALAPRRDGVADELRTLRLAYYALIDIAVTHKNVLLIDWTMGDTPDYKQFYTDALDQAGLSYTVYGMGEANEHLAGEAHSVHPPYQLMARHDLVLFNGNMSPVSMHQPALTAANQPPATGMYQYKNLVLGGGNLLIAGQGTQGWWRYLNRTRLADTPANRVGNPETFPYAWSGASQNVGCEMCLARYFAGFTPVYTATLSGKVLLPFPMPPTTPEQEVTLAPAAARPFPYRLDLSTGARARDGAAGNQYRFASGRVAGDYQPSAEDDPTTAVRETQLLAGLGDIADAQGVMERYSRLAQPLWLYPVNGEDMVVGTYIAGQQRPDANVPWNAMYWGFGLEGVGEAGPDTASRDRLLGDTFNFLARNVVPRAVVLAAANGQVVVQVDLGPAATRLQFTAAEISHGDGHVEILRYASPRPAAALRFTSDGSTDMPSDHITALKLIPVPGTAAPVYVTVTMP